jgi:lipid-binding SYLF domain-containing protein
MKTLIQTSCKKFLLSVLSVCLIVVIVGFLPFDGFAKRAKEIDVSVDVTLEKFYKQVKGAEQFLRTAKGVLVLPGVIKGAFIIGAEYGEGALRVGGRSVDYYNLVSGSFGLQIGGQAKDIIIMFMTRDALKSFRAGQGWEVGMDGNVVLIDLGGGKGLSTYTGQDPIVGFVFDAKGLIADISLKGAKFTRLEK